MVSRRHVQGFLPLTIFHSMGHLVPLCTAVQLEAELRTAPWACQADSPHPAGWWWSASFMVVSRRHVSALLPLTTFQSMGHLSPECTCTQLEAELRLVPWREPHADRPHPAGCLPSMCSVVLILYKPSLIGGQAASAAGSAGTGSQARVAARRCRL